MRILLVNKFHYLKGGSEKYYFELAKLLREKGHQIAFFSMQNEKNVETGEKEYFVNEIDLNTGSKLKALDVIYSKENKKKMIEALEDFKPDIVHVNNFQRQLSESIIEAINEKNIPIIFTAHDLEAVCPNKTMLDENKNIISPDKDIFKAKYLSDISFSANDYTLNSLLSLIPNKIYIHLIDNTVDEFIQTLELVFENRINLCTDCNICDMYKNVILKSNSDDKKTISMPKNS